MWVLESGSTTSQKNRIGPGAVDSRRLRELVGNGHEELAEEEGGRGRGDERQREARVRIHDAEVGGHLERRE